MVYPIERTYKEALVSLLEDFSRICYGILTLLGWIRAIIVGEDDGLPLDTC